MKHILCYGDSNTWGYDPRSLWEDRYEANSRWCDLLEAQIGIAVINCGENGRTIPRSPFALQMLDRAIEQASPLFCLILLLGTNDILMGRDPEDIGNAMAQLISRIRQQFPEVSILLLAPPPLHLPEQDLCQAVSQLGTCYRRLAQQQNLAFLDLQTLPLALSSDGVHLSSQDHRLLARVIAASLKNMPEC